MATTTQTVISDGDLELHHLPSKSHTVFESTPQSGSTSDTEQRVLGTSGVDENVQEPPSNAVDALEKWNDPNGNMWRVFSTFWSFFILGMNDGSLGALIPYLEAYYKLSYTVVSLIFISPFLGYALASITNNLVHIKYGQRGVAIFGPLCHLLSFIIIAVHPPYPVIVVVFAFIGFGNGLIDAAWCAWLGNMASANEVQGVLQGCYAFGATVAPLISTTMFTKGGLQWYTFYYIMVAGSAIELATSAYTFWSRTGAHYQALNPIDPNSKTGRTREALKNPITYVFALFIFGYMGAEISLGGWIVKFMTTVRHAPSFESGLTATGFWAGMTLGRLILPFITSRLGEHLSVQIYILIAIALELLFWLIPSFIFSAIFIAFLGFVLGPLFGTAIVLTTKLTPRHLHVGTVGFGAAIGGSGGAVFPFLVGVIAQRRGVQALQPVVLALLVGIGACWVVLPRVRNGKTNLGRKGRVGRGMGDVEGEGEGEVNAEQRRER